MTLREFIEEIHTDLSSYSDSSDIDNNSIKTWVISCLRKLGLNIAYLEEDIIKVKNSQVKLKDTFLSLRLALLAEPIGCNDKKYLQTDNYIIRQRIENPVFFSQITQGYIRNCDSKIITEKITIGDNPLEFYYSPKWLTLVKGIDKKVIAADCLNLHPSIRRQAVDEISITGNTLNTNFSEGYVYLQYYSLPTSEGEIEIPEFTTTDIVDWVSTFVKVKITENIIANNKNPQGLAQLYPVWKQDLMLLKPAAIKEARFHTLPKDWHKTYAQKLRKTTAQYNLPFIKF
jgi:hypothetical protein